MKATAGIPSKLKLETAHHNDDKMTVAGRKTLSRHQRLRKLNTRLRGTLADFMTQADLKAMREDAG